MQYITRLYRAYRPISLVIKSKSEQTQVLTSIVIQYVVYDFPPSTV